LESFDENCESNTLPDYIPSALSEFCFKMGNFVAAIFECAIQVLYGIFTNTKNNNNFNFYVF